jgi:hypothetical protein
VKILRGSAAVRRVFSPGGINPHKYPESHWRFRAEKTGEYKSVKPEDFACARRTTAARPAFAISANCLSLKINFKIKGEMQK